MRLNTCSGVISLSRELENESARFYEELSRKYAQDADIFLSFAKENKKNIVQVERTYYGVISDAIEGCFAFDLNPDEYKLETEPTDRANYPETVNKAIGIEETVIKFYSDAAAQSEGLMADIPRAFKLVARRREGRRPKLESLLEES
ncbi:hypothetical protein ACFLU9_01375 [Chloroflexota bacterium]